MKKMKRMKVLSVLLCLVMLLSCLPVTVFAEGETSGEGWELREGILDITGKLTELPAVEFTKIEVKVDGVLALSDGTAVAVPVFNNGTISGGTFKEIMTNDETITGGVYEKSVDNLVRSVISGGTFKNSVINRGTITGGIYHTGGVNYSTGVICGAKFLDGAKLTNNNSAPGSVKVLHKINGSDAELVYDKGTENLIEALNAAAGRTADAKGIWYCGDQPVGENAMVPLNYTEYTLKYEVLIPANLVGGSVTATPDVAAKNENVYLTVSPDANYRTKVITAMHGDNQIPVSTSVSGYDGFFIMPGGDVTVAAEFERLYQVTTSGYNRGQIYVSADANKDFAISGKFAEGDTVYLDWNMTETIYDVLKELTVTDADNNEITVTDNHFIMPGGDVLVTAVFGLPEGDNWNVDGFGNLRITGKVEALPDVKFEKIIVEEGSELALSNSVTVRKSVDNYGTVSGGTYSELVENHTMITGGVYCNSVKNYANGTICNAKFVEEGSVSSNFNTDEGSIKVLHSINGKDMELAYIGSRGFANLLTELQKVDAEGEWRKAADNSSIGEDETVPSHYTKYLSHKHKVEVFAEGGTLKKACKNTDGNCLTPEAEWELKLKAPAERVYDGREKHAVLEFTDWVDAAPAITYKQGATVLNSAPVNAGTYTASVTAEDVTASVEFTIEPAAASVDQFRFTAPNNLIYDGTEKHAEFVWDEIFEESDITVTYYAADGNALEGAPVNAGTYTVKLSVDSGNYAAEGLSDSDWRFTVAKRDLIVTANNQVITKGENIDYTACSVSGLPANHRAEVVLQASTTDVTTDGVITATATVKVSDRVVTENFNVTYVDGELVILPDVTANTVGVGDEATLEAEKAQLEQHLQENGDDFTEAQKQEIEDAIDRIDAAMEVLEAVEEVEADIASLPETAEADDVAARNRIKAAQAAYEELSSHGKTLVSEESKSKLDDLLDDVAYKIVKGGGSKWTVGASTSLTFTANGAYSEFTALKVDGKTVNAKYYEAKSGSTIITLKVEFLKTLKEGTHTIQVVYSDEEASSTFNVTKNPATGDDSNVMLWAGLTGGSLVCLAAAVFVLVKKRKNDE